ncbi:MAG: hypothetical protein JWP34_2117 [Massilia sp.]|nr:hypothetical protein [Massilia sp.]
MAGSGGASTAGPYAKGINPASLDWQPKLDQLCRTAVDVAATHVGLDLHALRVDQLEREVIDLERKTGQ